eukprot:Sspe_Gene.49973::Locus_27393_Transcript_1_1_Confidence_1.000_Length_444::g.49973::m.49973
MSDDILDQALAEVDISPSQADDAYDAILDEAFKAHSNVAAPPEPTPPKESAPSARAPPAAAAAAPNKRKLMSHLPTDTGAPPAPPKPRAPLLGVRVWESLGRYSLYAGVVIFAWTAGGVRSAPGRR